METVSKNIEDMEDIEDIIMRHSNRGMPILREHLPSKFCKESAEYILSWKKGVIFITTGFYVAGHAETDGPPGALIISLTLKKLGYIPVILTDKYCKNFFEKYDIKVIYMDIKLKNENKFEFIKKTIEEFNPIGMISIERCGLNIHNKYANMKNISINEHTAEIDLFFANYYNKIPTIGIGDGGNEIGMGNLEHIIKNKLNLIPCKIKVDKLIISTVSNWGGYGLAAYLCKLTNNKEFFETVEKTVKEYIKYIISIGSVDGITHENKEKVDGHDIEVELKIIRSLCKVI